MWLVRLNRLVSNPVGIQAAQVAKALQEFRVAQKIATVLRPHVLSTIVAVMSVNASMVRAALCPHVDLRQIRITQMVQISLKHPFHLFLADLPVEQLA